MAVGEACLAALEQWPWAVVRGPQGGEQALRPTGEIRALTKNPSSARDPDVLKAPPPA